MADLDQYADLQPFVAKEIQDALNLYDKKETTKFLYSNTDGASLHVHNGTDSPVLSYPELINRTRWLMYRIVSPTTSCAVGNVIGGVVRMPFAGHLPSFSAFVDTAGTTGSMTIDFNLNGVAYVANVPIASSALGSSTFTSLYGVSFKKGDFFSWDVNSVCTTPALGLTVVLKIIETTK